jgi:hypothetical protein
MQYWPEVQLGAAGKVAWKCRNEVFEKNKRMSWVKFTSEVIGTE